MQATGLVPVVIDNSIFDDNQVSEQLVQELIDQTRQWPQDGILVFGFRPLTTQQIITLENQLSGFNEAAVKNGL